MDGLSKYRRWLPLAALGVVLAGLLVVGAVRTGTVLAQTRGQSWLCPWFDGDEDAGPPAGTAPAQPRGPWWDCPRFDGDEGAVAPSGQDSAWHGGWGMMGM